MELAYTLIIGIDPMTMIQSTRGSRMTNWLDNALRHLQIGESLLTDGVDGLCQGGQASTDVNGKLCTTGAGRWQTVIRQMQTPVNFADILRARALL
jgi:hypothetical protein